MNRRTALAVMGGLAVSAIAFLSGCFKLTSPMELEAEPESEGSLKNIPEDLIMPGSVAAFLATINNINVIYHQNVEWPDSDATGIMLIGIEGEGVLVEVNEIDDYEYFVNGRWERSSINTKPFNPGGQKMAIRRCSDGQIVWQYRPRKPRDVHFHCVPTPEF